MFDFKCQDCHLLITQDDLKEQGEGLCPNCGGPNLLDLTDDPWLQQAAEYEANAREGVWSPPPPGYPFRSD